MKDAEEPVSSGQVQPRPDPPAEREPDRPSHTGLPGASGRHFDIGVRFSELLKHAYKPACPNERRRAYLYRRDNINRAAR